MPASEPVSILSRIQTWRLCCANGRTLLHPFLVPRLVPHTRQLPSIGFESPTALTRPQAIYFTCLDVFETRKMLDNQAPSSIIERFPRGRRSYLLSKRVSPACLASQAQSLPNLTTVDTNQSIARRPAVVVPRHLSGMAKCSLNPMEDKLYD